jgi:hypothetical protein
MASGPSPPSSQEGRVLRFRRRPSRAPTPVAGLDRYQRTGRDEDNYRHRMLVNLAAFVFVAGLIGAGVWLADTMATMRKNQDCVLAGHRNCTPVDIDRR